MAIQSGTLTTTTTQTLQTTQQTVKMLGTSLSNKTSDTQIDLGNWVSNISILPYLKSVTIEFAARGLKPNTRLYAYFGDVPVSGWVAPKLAGYAAGSVEGHAQTEPLGTPLYSDSLGNCDGIFTIPPERFKSQEITFRLVDISSLSEGEDAITTEADGVYYGSTLAVQKGNSLLNTRQTVVSLVEQKAQYRVNGLAVDQNVSQSFLEDPPPPGSGGGGSGCGCGSIICTKLYELGLMDKETYEADNQFGEYLRQSENSDIYWGYIRWASIVVNWMSGNTPNVMFWIRDLEKRRARELELTLKITHRIATPWAEHMQFLMGRRETDNKVGKLIMSVGVPISKLVNKLPKFNNKNPGWFTKCSMIGLFVILYNISKMFGGKFGFPEPINIKSV
jgi:hypothetical protein